MNLILWNILILFMWAHKSLSSSWHIPANKEMLGMIDSSSCSRERPKNIPKKRCSPAHCMELFTEMMPEQWVSDAFNKSSGPLWSPFDDIMCIATISGHKHPCYCELSAFNSNLFFNEFENTRSLFFGDSTIRNAGSFFEKFCSDLSYGLFSGDINFQDMLENSTRLAFVDSMHRNSPQAFISATGDFLKITRNIPRMKSGWEYDKDGPCRNVTEFKSSVRYVHESYELLDKVNFFFLARSACVDHPSACFVRADGWSALHPGINYFSPHHQ
jgi:hypothetical protein